MAREAMLAAAPTPAGNIHPVPTLELDHDAVAVAYHAELQHAYAAASLTRARPLSHIGSLGLGCGGHTPSLLPGEPVLEERSRWAAAVAHGRPETRIILTYPVIDASNRVAFLVSGAGKRDILRQVLSSRGSVPAPRLQLLGELVFIADRDAAGE